MAVISGIEVALRGFAQNDAGGKIMADWNVATLQKSEMTAVNVKALSFSVENWQKHEAGQHYDIRLTSETGYQAERSYSIASPPEERGAVELGIQLLDDGEVSPYLFQMRAGDQLELRGPIGGHFVWDISMPGPLALIGGGSGMVPLMAMLRHHVRNLDKDRGREIAFLVSSRTIDHVLYRPELETIQKQDPNFRLALALTDMSPEGWSGYTRRVDETMLREVFGPMLGKMPMMYVCGPTPFVEVVANGLVAIGFNPHEIKTERFGGSSVD